MYNYLLPLHSVLRWLVLIFLVLSILRSITGFKQKRLFTKGDNLLRHWTATIAHIQLIVGMLLYLKSPLIQMYWKSNTEHISELSFFSVFHALLMFIAITLLTIGSAKAKRAKTPNAIFKLILIYYSLSLLVILIAIPWPFSPFVSRPYLRIF